MYLEIVSPEKLLFSGEVTLVEVPGTQGPFVMLNRHAPIVSTLEAGKLRLVEESGRERTFDIGSGVVENRDSKIVVLIELPE